MIGEDKPQFYNGPLEIYPKVEINVLFNTMYGYKGIYEFI